MPRATRLREKKRLAGKTSPPTRQLRALRANGSIQRFVRDPNVISWVLNEAGGRCEACDDPTPFVRADGEPYLEVHHVRPLAEGGPDTCCNAIACCPECHRQLHPDPDRDRIRSAVIRRIDRLTDFRRTSANFGPAAVASCGFAIYLFITTTQRWPRSGPISRLYDRSFGF